MTDTLRAVFDTNVYVAAVLSKNAASPTRELLERLRAGAYVLLTCEAILDEVAEKLEDHNVKAEHIIGLLTLLEGFAEKVRVPAGEVEPVLSDPDDDLHLWR
ncbi:MAG: PIN domain-containing protein [Chloroflexi bacterium]|nr:PIN domain-containing protein [Chloroflexota bacterium]